MTETGPADLRLLLQQGAALFSTDLDGRPDLQLADDLRDLHRLRNLIDGELLRRLSVFDARGGAAAEHVLSTKAWLRGSLHLSHSAASGHVAVARRIRDSGGPLAVTLAGGELSYEQAIVIERGVA